MTAKQVVQSASIEVLHQSLIEDGLRVALRIKRRIHELLPGAQPAYSRALRHLENATDASEQEMLSQRPNPAGVHNLELLVRGLKASAIVQF